MSAAKLVNWVGLLTVAKREIVRSLKVINQVVWPPVITTILYVFVFGLAIGSRIQNVGGVSYAQFLIPGLIMLQTISTAYDECASSFFQGRFMNSIQELLVAPLAAGEILVGFLMGSLARAFLIALLIGGLGVLLVHAVPQNWWLAVLCIVIVTTLFSSLGLIFGLMAERFDHIAAFVTFVITPLTFVGGVFTSATMLPENLRSIELFNPIFYIIDAFRYSYTGNGYLPLGYSLGAISALAVVAVAIALRMIAVGYKLRA